MTAATTINLKPVSNSHSPAPPPIDFHLRRPRAIPQRTQAPRLDAMKLTAAGVGGVREVVHYHDAVLRVSRGCRRRALGYGCRRRGWRRRCGCGWQRGALRWSARRSRRPGEVSGCKRKVAEDEEEEGCTTLPLSVDARAYITTAFLQPPRMYLFDIVLSIAGVVSAQAIGVVRGGTTL